MRKRLLKYARRLLYVVLALGILGIAAFTWLCYWPLEGKVDDIMTLVPYRVEFVMRTDYDGLMATGWPKQNIEENPLHPTAADWVRATGQFRRPPDRDSALPALRERMAEIEQQINDNIPISASWASFGIEKDVLAGELVVAGRWCADFDPRQGPPSWQEILLLTRVSWRTRCIAALEHEFVREQINADPTAPRIDALDDGVFKLTFRDVEVSPIEARSGCGRDFVMPPENTWYLHRVKDVLALSNSESLINQVSELGRSEDASESFASRPDFDTEADERGVVAAADLTPLHGYLVKALERNPRAGILGRYLRPRSIEKFSGGLTLEAQDLLRGYATISYVKQDAGEVADKVYSLPQRDVSQGIGNLVPAKDTFATLFVRSDPMFLLMGIYEDALTGGERGLWTNNLKRMKTYDSVDEFFRDLAEFMGDTSTVALSRLSEIYDEYKYEEWFPDDPDPMMGVAIMTRIKHGRTFDELNEFLRSKVPFLGFESTLEEVEYRNYKYMHLKLKTQPMDLKHVDPAYILVEDHLIFVNNQVYLRQILDTIADGGRGSIAEDPAFQATMAALPSRGHVALFLDLEKLTRVPPDSTTPGGGFLWDKRALEVRARHDSGLFAQQVREEEQKKYRKPLSLEDDNKVEAEVSRRVKGFKARFSDFAEEYRRDLESLRRFAGFGFVFGAAQSDKVVDAQFSVSLRDAEPGIVWRNRR